MFRRLHADQCTSVPTLTFWTSAVTWCCVRARPSTWTHNPAGWQGLPAQFQWQGGPADAEYLKVFAGESYSVTANSAGARQRTRSTSQQALTTVDLGEDQVLCPGDAICLDPGYPTAMCTWQDGTVSLRLSMWSTPASTASMWPLGDCIDNVQVFIEVATPFNADLQLRRPSVPGTVSCCSPHSGPPTTNGRTARPATSIGPLCPAPTR